MTILKTTILAKLVILTCFVISGFAQTNTTPAKTPQQQLREFYYRGDVDLIVQQGKPLVEQPNAALETRVWFLTQALDYFGAIYLPLAAMLDEMKKTSPNDSWALLARAAATNSAGDAAALCRKAVAGSANNDILLLCLETLASKTEAVNDNEVQSFIEQYRERIESSADGLVAESNAVLRSTRSSAKGRETAAALLDRALLKDPHNERAIARKATNLILTKRFQEAQALIEPEILRGSRSVALHNSYFSILAKIDLPKEEKEKRLESAAFRLLEKTVPGPSSLPIFLMYVKNSSEESRKKIEDLILKKYPDNQTVRVVLRERIIAKTVLYDNGVEMPKEIRKQIAGELLAFMEQGKGKYWMPDNITPQTLYKLLIGRSATEVDVEQLFAAAKVVETEIAPRFANEVLNRKAHIPEIKKLAETRIDELLRKMQTRNKDWRIGNNFTIENQLFWRNLALWYDVLGYAHLQSGNIIEAAAKLTAAEQFAATLNFNADVNNPLHLAKLYQTKKEFDTAEDYLNKALAVNWFGEGAHPAIQAFRDFYLAKNGNKKGIEPFIAAVIEKDRARRKPLILATRIREAQPHPAFSLATLDGKTISSADLKGRIVVIKFWGTWCGPCVKELPEFQRLYEKYKNDPQVAILTIDQDDSPDLPKAFIARNKYTFPVLWQTDYNNKAGIKGYPTIWFLDQDGKIAFERVGGTSDLEAEFSWRIEALRQPKPTVPAASENK